MNAKTCVLLQASREYAFGRLVVLVVGCVDSQLIKRFIVLVGGVDTVDKKSLRRSEGINDKRVRCVPSWGRRRDD